ncbi:hypothetical protein [Psychrobacillus sp. FJAT-21963]|uniref:hypothetical protein n=1 Tax=Psychrobacillus sp. FJAT-21963 TaxID=1712028 RepID=UPI0006FED183|nr:hypothetical protein [Psychrobacillus sp. FJAT-21963]KQL34675.1 hypothetical protein AN959_13175 [Psychrobacillus sp. FJAT-21963]
MAQYHLEDENIKLSLLGFMLVVDFALFFTFNNSVFPRFALLGSGIGLSIIVLCWTGKKYTYFLSPL